MKTAIFDLDGTLLDTFEDLFESINKMLTIKGYPNISREKARQIIGYGALNYIKKTLPYEVEEKELFDCINVYNSIYDASGSPNTKVFDGMDKVLVELKKRGYKLAVLSNKPQHSTDLVYEKYLKKWNFDLVCGQSDKISCKPDPFGTYYVMEKLGAKKKDTFFIGDGDTDIITAINAGVKGIGVLWGNRTKEQLINAGGSVFANSPEELLTILL